MLILLRNFAFGCIIALTKIVFGIRLQTTSIILGIYNEMIDFLFKITEFLKLLVLYIFKKAAKNDVKQALITINIHDNLVYILGYSLVFIFLAKYISPYTEIYKVSIQAIVFGIILMSAFIPFNELKPKKIHNFAIIILVFLLFWNIFGLQSPIEQNQLSEMGFIEVFLIFLGGGIICALAELVPNFDALTVIYILGISTTLKQVTTGFSSFENILAFSLFILGFIFGFIFFTRLISYVIDRYKDLFLSVTTGLMFASLRIYWPFKIDGVSVAPWDFSIPELTKYIITITLSAIVIAIIRKVSEGKGDISTSFGDRKRAKITS